MKLTRCERGSHRGRDFQRWLWPNHDTFALRHAARVARGVSLEAFEHLLALSLPLHLERQTAGVSRSIQSLLNYTIENIRANAGRDLRRARALHPASR